MPIGRSWKRPWPRLATRPTASAPFWGFPSILGEAGSDNTILLDGDLVEIEVGAIQATYIIFLHRVEDRPTNYLDGFAEGAADGNELGHLVADYTLEYAGGARNNSCSATFCHSAGPYRLRCEPLRRGTGHKALGCRGQFRRAPHRPDARRHVWVR